MPPQIRSAGIRVRDRQYRLEDDVGRRVQLGHPWIYRDALGGRTVAEPTGAVVELVTGNRDYVGQGYVDQEHPVVIRCLSRDPDEIVRPGSGTIASRFARAVQLRWLAFGPQRPTAMRLFSGESEGLPGVTVDRYGDFVVVQWLSAGAYPWRDELYEAITAAVAPRGIYEQKRFKSLAGQGPPEPGVRAVGDEAPLEIVVDDTVCRYGVDVTAPLGVGYFPDMRLGHAAIERRARDRRVLNLFSYTGAFSVRALKAGAAEAVSVDTAAKAHARARRNLELSDIDPGRIEDVTGDAQKTLERFASRGRRFDLIICDPPTFSHGTGPGAQFSVSRNLAALTAACLDVLEPGGHLAVGTNSTKLSAMDLDRALAEGAALRHADLRIIERIGLPPDYPVAPGFPEGNYLKFVVGVRA